MTKDEELQALREENRMLKALVAELLPLKGQLAQANTRIKELEDRLAQDSRTSSKPPSSDGLERLPRSSHCRIRSYLSTMQKQGHTMLAALTAVFHGQPLLVAWAPELLPFGDTLVP
jgi:transposase